MFYELNVAYVVMAVFLFTGLAYFYAAVSSLQKDPKSQNRRSFTAMLTSLSVSSFFTAMMTISRYYNLTRIYWNIALVTVVLALPLMVRFMAGMIPESRRPVGKKTINALIALALILPVTGFFVGDVTLDATVLGVHFSYVSFAESWIFYLTGAFSFSMSLLITFSVFRWLKESHAKRDRAQLSTFLALLLAASPIALFTDIFIPIFADFTVPPAAVVVLLPALLTLNASMRKYRTLSTTAPNVAEYLFDSVMIPIFELDLNNIVSLTNKATSAFLGKDIVGKKFAELIEIDGKPPDSEFFHNDIYHTEVIVRAPTGRKHCDLSFSVEYDDYGEPLGKIVMLHDISQRVYLENLRKSMNTASTLLLNSTPDTFDSALHKAMALIGGAVNVHRVYIWQNHIEEGGICCTQLYEWAEGAPPQQGTENTVCIPYSVIAPNWLNRFIGNESINGVVADMHDEERLHLQEQDVVSVLAVPIFIMQELWGFVGFDDCKAKRVFLSEEEAALRSVGLLFAEAWLRNEAFLDLQKTQTQLVSALEQAKGANRAKSNFLASVSHEIRTPLNAILGTTQIALQKENLSTDIKDFFGTIYTSGSSLLAIINDLLDSSKIETGKMELTPAPYDIMGILNDAAMLNAVLIGEKPIEFLVEVDESLPSRFFGDPLRIKQILNNTLSNAIKYTSDGYVKFYTTFTRLEDDAEHVYLKFVIEDTGSGIKDNDLQKLFAEYWRFDNTHIFEGTGLGLPITKKLVEMMDGTIDVQSEFGKGSIFTITVRQKILEDEPIGRENAKILSSLVFSTTLSTDDLRITRELMPYGKVLVVDDMRTNLLVAEGVIEAYMIDVTLAESGFEAIRKIQSGEQYDVIFMDHMMPEMDGIEATSVIRDMGYEGAIVALTANAIIGNEDIF